MPTSAPDRHRIERVVDDRAWSTTTLHHEQINTTAVADSLRVAATAVAFADGAEVRLVTIDRFALTSAEARQLAAVLLRCADGLDALND